MIEDKPKVISSVKISRVTRNPDGVCLDEKFVQVDNYNIKTCEKVARKIYKEDLK